MLATTECNQINPAPNFQGKLRQGSITHLPKKLATAFVILFAERKLVIRLSVGVAEALHMTNCAPDPC